MRKSFTLIELIVVIGIIALLSGIGVSSYNGFQMSARDTRRKEDLKTITNALNSYYAVHGRFPYPNLNQIDPEQPRCPNGNNHNCYAYSTFGEDWILELVAQDFIEELPVDPINNGAPVFSQTSENYSYSYGNVPLNGQEYDLTARLENTNDPDICARKQYKWWFNGVNSWCGNYTGQLYEYSPNSY